MSPDDSYLRHQQQRWLRHDAHLWIRPDAARWVKPGFDPGEIYPTLRPKGEDERKAALRAEIAHGYRLLAVLREQLAEVKADMARRRRAYPEESKYSPSQPRVPAGNPDGGQWTDRSGGQSTATSLAQPMGNVEIGDVSGSSELGDLFGIKPDETRTDGVRLAANDTPDDPKPVRDPTPVREAAPLVDPAPEIPLTRPVTSAERTAVLRAAATWLMRNTGLGVMTFEGGMNNIEWLQGRRDLIATYRDEPKTLQELQQAVQDPKPGYDIHHIVEQTAAERFGFTRSEVNDPENLVRIPRLRHYEITGWYGTENEKFDGLSPRKYLKDKDWEERYRVGLDALRQFQVLK